MRFSGQHDDGQIRPVGLLQQHIAQLLEGLRLSRVGFDYQQSGTLLQGRVQVVHAGQFKTVHAA